MAKYSEQDESYISMLVTERYWNDIKNAFGGYAANLTKQIYYCCAPLSLTYN